MRLAAPPIVICEDDDLQIYPSIEIASGELEAEDVLDGVYEAFDSLARPLELTTQNNLVFIRLLPDAHPDPVELTRRMLVCLQHELSLSAKEVAHLGHLPLNELLAALLRSQRPDEAE